MAITRDEELNNILGAEALLEVLMTYRASVLPSAEVVCDEGNVIEVTFRRLPSRYRITVERVLD
jgi:hypothetical protein